MNYYDDCIDNQDSFDIFHFNELEEPLNEYYFNQIEEDNKSKQFFKIDITNKNTQPTLNPIGSQNIIDYEDLNENCINGNKLDDKTKQKVLGRKRKNSKEVGKHDKYSEDNIIRKIKSTLLNFLRIFINSFIYDKFNGNIGEGIFKKEILKMNQTQIIYGKDDKQLLNRTLKNIFSYDLSKKYSTFDSNHNKKIIEFLLKETDEEKKIEFQNLFSLTFMDCLNHFSGIKSVPILEGMKLLKDLCKKFKDEKVYLDLLKYYTLNFENIIKIKRNRKRRKKNGN
mgnify:CR=1 FL=1